MLEEFKKFALRGNVVDLAIGIIIGAAFTRIVESLVGDVFMPSIGAVTGGLDFSNYFIALKAVPPNVPMVLAEVKKAGVPILAYGNFITIVLYFIILAFIIFMMVKWINRLKTEAPPATPAEPPEDVKLLREIRDALRR